MIYDCLHRKSQGIYKPTIRINEFSNIEGCKFNTQNQLYSCILVANNWKVKIKRDHRFWRVCSQCQIMNCIDFPLSELTSCFVSM